MTDRRQTAQETPDSHDTKSRQLIGPALVGAIAGVAAFTAALLPAGLDVALSSAGRAAIVAAPISLLTGMMAQRAGCSKTYGFALSIAVCLLLCLLLTCNITR